MTHSCCLFLTFDYENVNLNVAFGGGYYQL